MRNKGFVLAPRFVRDHYFERAIIRPLPRSITDRIPAEVYECIIFWLRWDVDDLHSCTLVCRAWYHHSQCLLYYHVDIRCRRDYNATVKHTMRSPRARKYMAFTRILSIRPLWILPAMSPPSRQSSSSKQCPSSQADRCPMYSASESHIFRAHPIIAISSSTWLNSRNWSTGSCGILCCIPSATCAVSCASPNLRILDVNNGRLAPVAAAQFDHHHAAGQLTPENGPRLINLSLQGLKPELLSPFATWIASSDVFS